MAYQTTNTFLPGVLILEPVVHRDNRGFFFESFNQVEFEAATGLCCSFVQDNHSQSKKNVLRGLHYQIKKPQGKLVRVIRGCVFDVVVDMRKNSPNFGNWFGVFLSAENMKQLWVPPGFAHGFYVTSESAEFIYKTTEYWHPNFERTVMWNDSSIGIEWPLQGNPKLTSKDEMGTAFAQAESYSFSSQFF